MDDWRPPLVTVCVDDVGVMCLEVVLRVGRSGVSVGVAGVGGVGRKGHEAIWRSIHVIVCHRRSRSQAGEFFCGLSKAPHSYKLTPKETGTPLSLVPEVVGTPSCGRSQRLDMDAATPSNPWPSCIDLPATLEHKPKPTRTHPPHTHSKTNMGGRSSKPRCPMRERTFLLLNWDAAFLNRMMRFGTATPPADQPSAGFDLTQVLASASPPVIDARRLVTLIERNPAPSPAPLRWVRARLVLFNAEVLTPSLSQHYQNSRLYHVFRRRHYYPILGPTELQALAIGRALQRFQRRSRRLGPGVVVVVGGGGGDGTLEANASYAASLRSMLGWGHRLEVWAWDGAVPNLYKVLQGEWGEARVDIRYLDNHRQAIRYGAANAPPPRVPTAAAAAAAAGGGGGGSSGASPAPVLPVAIPVAVGIDAAAEHTPPPPLGKDMGVEEEEGEGSDDTSDEEEARHHRSQHSHGTEEEEDEVPEPFLDPLTMELMVDPVLTPSGYSYERAVILEQITRRGVDPMTMQPLAEADLRPNRALREMIELWRSQQQGGGGAGESKGDR